MTEELKNAMRNATDEILMTLDKYNVSSEDMKIIHDNLRIILLNQTTKENKMENEQLSNEHLHCKLDFSQALSYLKKGVKLARQNWNGKGMWIELQVPDEHSKMTRPYLYLNYPDNQRVPWAPSQTDILSNDWYDLLNHRYEGSDV